MDLLKNSPRMGWMALGALAVFLLLLGCAAPPPAVAPAPAAPSESPIRPPQAVAPAPTPPAPAEPAPTAPEANASQPAPADTCGRECLWGELNAAQTPEALPALCDRMSAQKDKDACLWFLAAVKSDRNICEQPADGRYRSACIMEVNGQRSCSPASCSNCVSAETCLEFPTCAFDKSRQIPCRQESALHGPY